MNDQAEYKIVVVGSLGERWAEWFKGLTIQQETRGSICVTSLCGVVQDQSSLLGMLQTLINLSMTILLVERTELS